MSETIVFFGSGPVAARSLELAARDFNIEAVVTKPKPMHHKGSSPVLELSESLGLRVFTPANKLELSELLKTTRFKSRIGLVIDYGIIISRDVIDSFPLGIINSHFSLLPEWRGADPITFAILSGQKTTGVSLMLITEGMDEGPVLAQSPYDMPSNITTPDLTNDLIELSHNQLVAVLPLYIDGKVHPAPQEAVTIVGSPEPTYSRKLTKDDGIIDWQKPAEALEREIRAFIEWPKSRATIAGKEVIITKAHVVDDSGEPGKAAVADKQIIIYCGEKALALDRLKPSGKKEMTSEAFLAGYKLS